MCGEDLGAAEDRVICPECFKQMEQDDPLPQEELEPDETDTDCPLDDDEDDDEDDEE
jgi:hypothetical protein